MLPTAEKNVALKVILDSNFLFVPLQFKIDVFDGIMNLLNRKFEPILLSTNYQELHKMATSGGPRLRKQAATALKLAERCRVVSVERNRGETNDDVILRVASRKKWTVATNDRELIKKLRDDDIPVIFLRGKSRLELEGAL